MRIRRLNYRYMEIKTMTKKKTARRPQPRQQPVEKKESNFWKITAIVAVVLLAGVTAKTMFPGGESTTTITPIQATSSQPIPIQPITGPSPAVQVATSTATNSIEDQVRQVAVNFKCACEGCGELPLAECQCDMPKGAVEEKSFIRTKLLEGNTVPQVIELVDKKYGLRV
jgi:enamine deaminase RidA (YjgF/YER057c/UK114 family)